MPSLCTGFLLFLATGTWLTVYLYGFTVCCVVRTIHFGSAWVNRLLGVFTTFWNVRCDDDKLLAANRIETVRFACHSEFHSLWNSKSTQIPVCHSQILSAYRCRAELCVYSLSDTRTERYVRVWARENQISLSARWPAFVIRNFPRIYELQVGGLWHSRPVFFLQQNIAK